MHFRGAHEGVARLWNVSEERVRKPVAAVFSVTDFASSLLGRAEVPSFDFEGNLDCALAER